MSYRLRSTPSLETFERRALLSAGQLDPSFGGGDGIVSAAPGAAGSFNDVAVLPGNKLLAVGTTLTTGGGSDVSLSRFNADIDQDWEGGARAEIREVFPVSDRVVVRADWGGTGRASGIDLLSNLTSIFTVRDRQIIRNRDRERYPRIGAW